MAKKQTKLDAQLLTLTLDGNEITAEKFIKSVSAFVSIIRDVTENLSGEKNSIKWIVSVEKGSTRVHFTPKPVSANPVLVSSTLRAVKNGFLEIEKGERPSHWPDSALTSAKEMVSVYTPEGGALDTISVASGGDAATILTKNTGVNVDTLIGVEKRAFGTVEGRLETLSEAGSLHIVVKDALTHRKIRCLIEEQDTEKFMAAFRKRVAVYGEIRYRRDGVPLSIKASDLRVMRDAGKLPTIQEMIGIYA